MAKRRGRGTRPEDLVRSTKLKAPAMGEVPLSTDVGIYGGGLGGPPTEGASKRRGNRGRGRALGQGGGQGVGRVNRAVRAAQQSSLTPIGQSTRLTAGLKPGGTYAIPPAYGGVGGGGGGGAHHHHHH